MQRNSEKKNKIKNLENEKPEYYSRSMTKVSELTVFALPSFDRHENGIDHFLVNVDLILNPSPPSTYNKNINTIAKRSAQKHAIAAL